MPPSRFRPHPTRHRVTRASVRSGRTSPDCFQRVADLSRPRLSRKERTTRNPSVLQLCVRRQCSQSPRSAEPARPVRGSHRLPRRSATSPADWSPPRGSLISSTGPRSLKAISSVERRMNITYLSGEFGPLAVANSRSTMSGSSDAPNCLLIKPRDRRHFFDRESILQCGLNSIKIELSVLVVAASVTYRFGSSTVESNVSEVRSRFSHSIQPCPDEAALSPVCACSQIEPSRSASTPLRLERDHRATAGRYRRFSVEGNGPESTSCDGRGRRTLREPRWLTSKTATSRAVDRRHWRLPERPLRPTRHSRSGRPPA